MTVVAIVQARLGSTRLPGKVLHHIGAKPMVIHVLDRAKAIPGVDVVVAAIPDQDETLAATIIAQGYFVHGGPEADVLTRFYWTARDYQADHIVRITADCPLLDPTIAGELLRFHRREDRAYTSNVWPQRTCPDGLDIEVIARGALHHAWAHARNAEDREHVTSAIQATIIGSVANYVCPINLSHHRWTVDLSHHRWTVDTEEDLEFVCEVYRLLPPLAYRLEDTLAAINTYRALCKGCQQNALYLKRGSEIIWDLHQYPVPEGRVFGPCEAWAIKKRYFADKVEAW